MTPFGVDHRHLEAAIRADGVRTQGISLAIDQAREAVLAMQEIADGRRRRADRDGALPRSLPREAGKLFPMRTIAVPADDGGPR